ncbi:hypothetical protein RQP46_003929 [Phenoliferia psychrophenolica]
MASVPPQLRSRARQLYKELIFMSREYNQGILPDYPIQQRLHKCFAAYIGGDEERVREGIRKAEFIQKGSHPKISEVQIRATAVQAIPSAHPDPKH